MKKEINSLLNFRKTDKFLAINSAQIPLLFFYSKTYSPDIYIQKLFNI